MVAYLAEHITYLDMMSGLYFNITNSNYCSWCLHYTRCDELVFLLFSFDFYKRQNFLKPGK